MQMDKTYGITGGGEYVPTQSAVPTDAAQMSMGVLVALSDQLQAACYDVGVAWHDFTYGQSPQGGTTIATERTADRIEHIGRTMHEQIRFLANLADDIRRRTG